MTNQFIAKTKEDILQNLEDDISLEFGEIGLDVVLGHIEDGDAIPARLLKIKRFMKKANNLIAFHKGEINEDLKEIYDDEYYDLTYEAARCYPGKSFGVLMRHAQENAPLDTNPEIVDEEDIEHFTEMATALVTLYALAH